MPDEVDVAGIARTLPYRDEEIQRAHDHLKLAIEAAAAIALSQNRTLDSAAYMVGSAIKAAASVPADTTETAMPPPFRRALVLRHPENARDSIPDWVEVDFEEIRKGDLFTLVASDGTETGIAFAESDAKGEPPPTYGALLAENARLREERDKERRARIDAEADYTVCLAERDALRARVEALGEVGGRLHDAMRVFDTGCLHSHRVRDARAAWRILMEKPDAK